MFDQALLEAAEQNPEARYLMRQPYVGPITALAVVLTLGPVERFASARKVASYVGLIPAEYSSGKRQRLGHISKEAMSSCAGCWWRRPPWPCATTRR